VVLRLSCVLKARTISMVISVFPLGALSFSIPSPLVVVSAPRACFLLKGEGAKGGSLPRLDTGTRA